MSVKKLVIPDVGEVSFYKKRSSRVVRLSFSNTGQVRVSMPRWVPYRVGIDFVRAKQTWIIANKPVVAPHLKHNDRIGKAHRLIFYNHADNKKVTTRLVESEVRVSLPQNIAWNTNEAQAAAQKASIKALKAQAERLLPLRLNELALKHDFKYRSVTIRQLRSRWGSCNQNQEITLNLFLLQLPWDLIDYVLIHELTHTRLLKHGEAFWVAMQTTLPNVKSLKKAISAYQPVLKSQNFVSEDKYLVT